MKDFTHFDKEGRAVMVDVSHKDNTQRTAVAKGSIKVSADIMKAILGGESTKGDVLGIARTAGIMATKQTSNLIPLCHPLMITKATVDFQIDKGNNLVESTCTVKLVGQTGVEMEALTGVSVSLLTIYDMCKAIDKGMRISDIRLVSKSGGKSGDYAEESGES